MFCGAGRVEPPAALLECLRNDDLKLKVHLAVAFGYVPEGCCNESGVKHIVCDHLSIDIPYSLHEEELSTLSVVHPERITVGTGEVVLAQG